MKNIQTLGLALSAAFAFLLPACKKDGHYPPDPTGIVPCQVRNIIIPAEVFTATNAVTPRTYVAQNIPYKQVHSPNITPGKADTLVFTYNNTGKPVSIVHRMDIGDNLLFKYDRLNRLTEYVNIYPSNTAGDYWHKYTYAGSSDRIIADTAFRDFTSNDGHLTGYNDIDLTVFKYDAYGRISAAAEYVDGDTLIRSYSYDADGNLQGNGARYDKKLNIHRTNSIWMLLDRDYSVNNPVDKGSYTYNSMGLPKTINTNSASVTAAFEFIVIGYPFSITNAIIDYSCP